jgi:hypothetical protein
MGLTLVIQVAGEIRAFNGRASKRTLNIGAFLGVITVWILYVLVTLAMVCALGPHTTASLMLF